MTTSCRVALALLPALAIAGPARTEEASAELLAQRREKIAAMSEIERNRLRRNFENFRRLPAAEQERLRQLDRDLKDDAQHGGNLKAVMQDYVKWLETLEPGQRTDLLREQSPERRARLVRDLRTEQRALAEFYASRRQGMKLSSEDLATVVDFFEEQLKARRLLTAQQLEELAGKPAGLARQVFLLELALGYQDGQQWHRPLLMLSPEEFEVLVGRLSNAAHKKALRDRQGEARFGSLMWLINAAIWSEFEKLKPSEEELGQFLAELDGTEQEQALKQPLERFDQELIRLYMEKHPDRPQPPRWYGGPFDRFRARQRGKASQGARRPGAAENAPEEDGPQQRGRLRGPMSRNQPPST